jgi:hypothetical protein
MDFKCSDGLPLGVLHSLFGAHRKSEIGVLVDQLIVLIGLGGPIFISGRSGSTSTKLGIDLTFFKGNKGCIVSATNLP